MKSHQRKEKIGELLHSMKTTRNGYLRAHYKKKLRKLGWKP